VLSIGVNAQQAASRSNAGVDESSLTALHGTVHPLARAEYDQGAVADEFPVRRLLLLMARPADREKDLQQFLRDVHSPGSAMYHHWVTPEEFGARFGAADEDTQLISGWLQSHGLAVSRVTKSKSMIEFSGTAGQVREALHTEIHRYSIQGKTYYANSSEIAVPQAVALRIAGFAPLNSFPLDSYVKLVGGGTMNRASHRVAPQFTLSENNAPFYALGPEDFATQYDVTPVYAAGNKGAGQAIGIIGEGNLNLALVDAYRKLFNLPPDHTQIIIDGEDPGDGGGPNVEGYLDVEVSGAVAPDATVNFYIAGAEAVSSFESNPLTFAAVRAVEDNQASVLSVSFGQCEQIQGEAGNQLWENLWEQAATQGQTVFVSSGDSGPTTCPTEVILSNGSIQYTDGLNVNGISSTPWNVSVGGTDFYYSDYASGAPSAATLWNQTNDSFNGSLKAPLPEQVWDNSLGFDVISTGESAAGGGGVSNCSQTTVPTDETVPTCLAGYPKPLWQNAPGVPNDQARDLPDVSLFASNGVNLSATPICADPGDCAPVTSGDPQVFLVGGTSVSSPAMAGVMALIDQKYGRQGQANYTFYALARQVPGVFHDITLGTNDVFCMPDTSPDCDTPVPNESFEDSWGVYAAGPGYDLASGLGSVDVSQLLNNWNKVTYSGSTTTLQASPASIIHGSPVTVSVAVKANSGSATPTGNVVLAAGAGTTIPQNTPLTLTNGAASASLTNLPGGSYELTAEYGGDGSFASSASTPVSLTVTPEASTTALVYGYRVLITSNPPAKGQAYYGSDVHFKATPSSQATKTTGLATGTVTFTDGGTSAIIPLDLNGVATWWPQNFAIGDHSVTATYSGDASYQASTSTPLAVTVVKGAPQFLVVSDSMPIGAINGEVYQPGTNQVLSVLLSGTGPSTPPTGTVTVNFGSLTQTVNLAAISELSSAWVTFANVPSGIYNLSASYSGDANWNAATYSNSTPFVYATTSLPTTTTTTALTLSPSTVDSSGSVTFNVTSQAASNQNGCWLGGDFATLYANGVSFGFVQVSCSLVNGVVTISGSTTMPASELPYGTYQVVAEYMGDGIQLPSFSSAAQLTVTVTDFSLSMVGKNLSVSAGKSISVPVALGGPSSAPITVALSCIPSSASITCAVSPDSQSITGSSTASLTINAFTSTTTASPATSAASKGNQFPLKARGGLAFALLVLLVLPGRRRSAKLWGVLVLSIGLSLAAGCGSGSGQSTGTTGTTITPAPAGSYSVTVTGLSGGIIHSATVNLVVH
jgi:subtilase family serine protease